MFQQIVFQIHQNFKGFPGIIVDEISRFFDGFNRCFNGRGSFVNIRKYANDLHKGNGPKNGHTAQKNSEREIKEVGVGLESEHREKN